jgi:hypothetical protein
MRVFERLAGRLAVILEEQNVFETHIAAKVEHAIAVSPEEVLDPLLGHVAEGLHVLWRFDDHFVRADAVHLVVHAVGFAVHCAFDTQDGEFV